MHIDEVRNNQFYQFPQWLLEEPYNKLSHRAMLMYMLLWDRRGLSEKNGWYDKNGKVYVYFTNEQFMEILKCSKQTVVTTKEELHEFDLLKEVRQGVNKPNRLYINGSLKTRLQEVQNLDGINTNIIKTNISNINNNTSEQNPLKKIVYTIRQNWGKDLTPIELETVTKMLGDYPFEIIDFAISEATLRNKKTIRWVERCCLDWYVYNNLETVTAIQDYLLAKKSWTREKVDVPDPNYPPPY
ncbi:DnaD domain protein [Streptococcus suis]|uniref:DnaD domain protein n=1 Tax=Streptococcus suis TaxID=1307 RepID=UPI0028762F92|nr:DnaD domain protein [Streptococcus suis]MDS1159984.1 DnaD domain protein [Streptococcus suis]MDY7601268.1 DnaD domain protein [Streptococcus suis]